MRFILSFTICAIEEEIYMVNYGCISDDRVFPLSVLYMKSYDVGVLDQLKKNIMNANCKENLIVLSKIEISVIAKEFSDPIKNYSSY